MFKCKIVHGSGMAHLEDFTKTHDPKITRHSKENKDTTVVRLVNSKHSC